jgi:hypothetical protein
MEYAYKAIQILKLIFKDSANFCKQNSDERQQKSTMILSPKKIISDNLNFDGED